MAHEVIKKSGDVMPVVPGEVLELFLCFTPWLLGRWWSRGRDFGILVLVVVSMTDSNENPKARCRYQCTAEI